MTYYWRETESLPQGLPENATWAQNGHKGIEKMQYLARDRICWQGMDVDIAEYVKHYKVFTTHKATQAIEQMLPSDIPEGTWQDLAADFFHQSNAEYLLADNFNK